MKLPHSFYTRTDVIKIAQELIGKHLFTKIDGEITGGIITETEAYAGVTDRASHAFDGRRTARNETMYAEGGTAYVYICYGIHSLFNVVTNKKNIPDAVLIRAIYPTHGIDRMLRRRKLPEQKKNLSGGPGTVGEALGIHVTHSGISLLGREIWIEDKGISIDESKISITKRIGVESSREAALLPYRFVLNTKGSGF